MSSMAVIISIQRCRSSLCSSFSSSLCCRSLFSRRPSERPRCSDSETSCKTSVDEGLVYGKFDAACKEPTLPRMYALEADLGRMNLKLILSRYTLVDHSGGTHLRSLRWYSLEDHSERMP